MRFSEISDSPRRFLNSLAEELGGTSSETNWPERPHHLQMKCMTPSVAASRCSRRGALARRLRVDVILPVETQPKRTVFKTEWNHLGPPGSRHVGESHSRSGGPGGVTWGGGGGAALHRQGRFYGRWFVSRGIGGGARIFRAQLLRLGSEGKRYSLQLSDGSGAEADASISSPPSVNNTPFYIVRRE